jgi:hypothetical protein
MRVITALFLALTVGAHGQFQILDGNTTASLRGIDSVSAQIAWASGSGGTVLLTTDGGANWKHCTVPPGGAKLDFRGVQGFDDSTAVIMASGKGTQSAIYKTTDGCATWKMVFANPDAEGFFDALRKVTSRQMYLMGDPVGGKFSMFYSADQGSTWYIADDPGLDAEKGDGGFAASNSNFVAIGSTMFFGTGGGAAAHVYNTYAKCADGAPKDQSCPLAWEKRAVPTAAGTSGSGVFSLAGRTLGSQSGKITTVLVAVGGNYEKPDVADGAAAFSKDGVNWVAATTPPHGYRSAVAYISAAQAWIAVGPNGTDISKNNGQAWSALSPAATDAPDADKNWNAISLPFVVGSKGKIGKLEAGTLGSRLNDR